MIKNCALKIVLFLLVGIGYAGIASAQGDLVRWSALSLETSREATVLVSNVTSSDVTIAGGVVMLYSDWGGENQFLETGSAGSWATTVLDVSKYIEFTISASAGYKIDLDKFNFYYRAGWTPQNMEVRYSKDDFVTYYTAIGSTSVSDSWTSASANIASANPIMPGQTLKVRIYAFNNGATLNIKVPKTNPAHTPTLTGTVSPAVVGDPADLSLTQTLDNLNPSVGDNVAFTIHVENLGPNTASGTTVTDLLPPGFLYTGHIASVGTYNNTTGQWNIGNLANGDDVTMTIWAEMQAAGPHTNTATVSHYGADPVSSNNTASITPSNVCAGCTHTISGGSITVNTGDIYCLHSGSWSGNVVLNGGTICIGQGASFTTSPAGSQNGTVINRGTMTYNLNNSSTHNIVFENHGTFNTTNMQKFSGSITNYGRVEMFSGTFTTTTGSAVITNYGKMYLNNVSSTNTTIVNHDSFVVNNNFYLFGTSFLENKYSAVVSLNMINGNTEIRGQLDNSGLMFMKNANSGQGISAVANNYGTLKIYDKVILGPSTYFTNDSILEFINIASVEFQAPLLQNNGRLLITDGNLSLHSSVSHVVNNGIAIVSGKVSLAAAGSKLVNNCRLVATNYFIGNGETHNNGLIWVTDYFQIDGTPSILKQSKTGSVRGDRFRNSGDISGYGSYYFTGNTNFESAGTFIGSSVDTPILFFDATPDGDIFDVIAFGANIANVIRPGSMIPVDTTSIDCSAIPVTAAGYPPNTQNATRLLCEVAPIVINGTSIMAAHATVPPGAPFIIDYTSARLFDYSNPMNPTDNSTNLIITGKGTFSVNTTNGDITFAPDPAFTIGTVVIEYRVSNMRSGDPIIYPSLKKKITINMGGAGGGTPSIQVGTF